MSRDYRTKCQNQIFHTKSHGGRSAGSLIRPITYTEMRDTKRVPEIKCFPPVSLFHIIPCFTNFPYLQNLPFHFSFFLNCEIFVTTMTISEDRLYLKERPLPASLRKVNSTIPVFLNSIPQARKTTCFAIIDLKRQGFRMYPQDSAFNAWIIGSSTAERRGA